VYVNEADMPSDPMEREGMYKESKIRGDFSMLPPLTCSQKTYTTSLTVRHLSELVDQVKDEQQYIVVRERTHRNTAESTNARVKWWNLFVIGIVIGESLFQVWWLRRFFEVKRVV
jgi:hypothetical protein